jgi:DNA-binding beta-propeller fold protein YncE/ABC-type Fe3+ transport system permease subunit
MHCITEKVQSRSSWDYQRVKKSRFLTIFLGVSIAYVVLFIPMLFGMYSKSVSLNTQYLSGTSNLEIIVRTFAWSFLVAIIATLIGWPLGVRIASLSQKARRGVQWLLAITLVVPSYAIFYVWWQAWPSGTALHAIIVDNGYLAIAVQVCLVSALVGWSWPIPALVSAMCNRSNSTLSVLYELDGLSLLQRCWLRMQQDRATIIATIILVASIIATNTTCFDLAQVKTIGNELRSVLASGGSAFSVPTLSFAGLCIALVASIFLLRLVPKKSLQMKMKTTSPWPIVATWCILSGLPLLVALFVTRSAVVELWDLYAKDIQLSALIALWVSLISVVLLCSSSMMHSSQSSKLKRITGILDYAWIMAAFLPASLIVSVYANAWHTIGLDIVSRTPLILVLAHLTKVGFVAVLCGRWVASCSSMNTLSCLDGNSSLFAFFVAYRTRLLVSATAVVGISFAISFGEVALTNQLAPPAPNQPIAVALLHAMHYQRPQLVTSALALIIVVAGLSGILSMFVHKKSLSLITLVLLVSCSVQEQVPLQNATKIGEAGRSDGQFTTPRAVAMNDEVIVVIDKTGRLQRFSSEGDFLSSWELDLDGTGFPTGISLDSEGLLWIADTHQNRILVLDQQGNEVRNFGEYGTEDGQFLYPTDIAFGNNGEVFVSEYGGNERINVFTRTGEFQYSFGHFGSDEEGFIRPQSIAVSPKTGNLFITDAGNHRIVERTQAGELVQIISSAGRAKGEVLYPYGIVFTSPDTFVVCEFGNNRIQKFMTNGESIATLGGAGDVLGYFKTPWAVGVDANGIVIADTGNNRLQRFPDMMDF